jgi:hypothetical protein
MISNCDEARRNGGPAFPSTQYANGISPYGHSEGMTLRDYFAAKAMQGFVSILNSEGGEPFYGAIATDSYKMADAMMEARK